MKLDIHRKIVFAILIVFIIFSSSKIGWSAAPQKAPIYINFFFHLESSPIKLPGTPARGSRTVKGWMELGEKYGIKADFYTTGLFIQQLMDDYPDIIDKIKQEKYPILRYPGVGHTEPNPVGRGRKVSIERLTPEQISREEIKVAWDLETKTLIPNWHYEKGEIVLGNPDANKPVSFDELSRYNFSKKNYWLYGGSLAIEKILGVIPLTGGLFKSQVQRRGLGRPSAVQKALGFGSYEISFNEEVGFPSIPAPMAQSGAFAGIQGVLPKYFGKRVGTDVPYLADTVEWLRALAINQPREQAMIIGFYLTSGTAIWQGGAVRNQVERIIKYVTERPEDFKVIWRDPMGYQWNQKNNPEIFFRRTYGVSSLEGMLSVDCPVEDIMKDSQANPDLFRRVSRTGWGTKEIKSPVRDYLNSTNNDISRKRIGDAARNLLSHWPEGDHDGNFGGPPPYIETEEGPLSLADGFQAFTYAIAYYIENNGLPDKVTVREVLGPVEYKQYDLEGEPYFDTRKLFGGYMPSELDRNFFPEPEIVNSQGLPPAGGGLNIVWPMTTLAQSRYVINAVQQVNQYLQKEETIPSGISMWFYAEENRGKRSNTWMIECTVNPAEFLYAMAQLFLQIDRRGTPGPIMFASMNIVSEQIGKYLMPSTPPVFEKKFGKMEQMEGFIWRKKVPKNLINAAWKYTPEKNNK